MRWAGGLAAAAIALVLLGACKASPPIIGDPPPTLGDEQGEREYRRILNAYSATAEVYSAFDTHLFAGATFQSWPFREARVRRLAQFQRMTPQEVEQKLAEERADFEKFNVFDLGTWTQNPKFDDFDARTSIWRIALVTDRAEYLPVEVRRVGRVDQNVRAIYPYMGMFWVQYRVKFPKVMPDGTPTIPADAEQVTLRLASTLGKADMRTAAH